MLLSAHSFLLFFPRLLRHAARLRGTKGLLWSGFHSVNIGQRCHGKKFAAPDGFNCWWGCFLPKSLEISLKHFERDGKQLIDIA